MVSVGRDVSQHVPACSSLDTDEILYVNFVDYNRKKEECNSSKQSAVTGGRKILLSTSTCCS
jgi:hypothetical protein